MNPNNKFLEKYKWFTDAFLLGCVFLLTCLPVVTLGAGIAALYRAVIKVRLHGEGYLFRTYWAAFKENLKQGILITVLFLVYVLLFGWINLSLASLTADGRIPAFFYALSWLLLIPPAVIIPWAFPYISVFSDRTMRVIGNSFTLGMTNLGITILAVLIMAAAALLLWFLLPVLPFVLTPMAATVFKRMEPVLMRVARQTDGYDENAWYARNQEVK